MVIADAFFIDSDHLFEKVIIFAMLLGVLGTYGPAEIIPYEPDMYNDSAGKRYWYSLFQGLDQAVFSVIY